MPLSKRVFYLPYPFNWDNIIHLAFEPLPKILNKHITFT